MKRLLLSFLALLCCTFSFAYDATIDGYRYNLFPNSHSASIVGHNNSISGDIIIPTTVTVYGVEYTVTTISEYAFQNCTSITSVTIQGSITAIHRYAFSGCTSLSSVSLANSVTYIDSYVFLECTSLTSVHLPNSLTYIGRYALSGCTSLTSVHLPNSLTYIGGGAFSGCTSLTTIDIPESLTQILEYTFYNCSQLTSVNLPTTLIEIQPYAFQSCKALESITVPRNVTKIGNQTFLSCSSLSTVICDALTPPQLGLWVFSNPEQMTLIVAKSAINDYKNASGWKEFGTIDIPTCAAPTLTIKDGKIMFSCATSNAEVYYMVESTDDYRWNVAKQHESVVPQSSITVSAYSSLNDYHNSEMVVFTIPASVGIFGDANGDGIISIQDITGIVNEALQE